jgi:hypothetical protein
VGRTGPVTRARSSARRTCVGLYGFDVRGPATFPKMQVHYWKNVLEILRNTVGAEVFRHVRPAVRLSLSVHFSRAEAVPTGPRQSSSARRSSTAPSPRAYTAAA